MKSFTYRFLKYIIDKMAREHLNELDPYTVTDDTFWPQILRKVRNNPNQTLPVNFFNLSTLKSDGKMFTKLVDDKIDKYLLVEFTSKTLEIAFIKFAPNIELLQEGLYRIQIV